MKKILTLMAVALTLTTYGDDGRTSCQCGPVSSVNVTNTTTTSATVNWTLGTGQTASCTFVVSVDDLTAAVGVSMTQVSGSTAYNITGLTPGHNYKVGVYISNIPGQCVGRPVSKNFTTLGGNGYCASGSISTGNAFTLQYLWLDFGISGNNLLPNGQVSAPSPGASYVPMPNIITLHKNQTVTNAMGIYYQPNSSTSGFTIYENLWIDYNQNGVFDATEKVMSGSITGSSWAAYSSWGQDYSAPITPNFTVPNFTANRLNARFILSLNQNVGPCDYFTEGQVIDFGVKIVP